MTRSGPGTRHIAFRADSSGAIGAGHLRRCLTLAETLRGWGREILFVCRAQPLSLNGDVEAAGFTLIELTEADTEESDASQSHAALAPFAPLEAVVIDHYGLGAAWERALRPLAGSIVIIDDLADRLHDCDILIDAAPQPERYDGLLPQECRLLTGPDFALLRPEFRQRRPVTPVRRAGINRLLVSFGTTDADNRCGAAISAIRTALGAEAEIDVVLGRNAPHREALAAAARADPRLQVHIDTDRTADLMAAADLGIGAGGVTAWERACVGLPALVAEIADNQHDTIAALVAGNAAIALPGDERLGDAIGAALAGFAAKPALLEKMSRAALALVDGRGAERAARAVAPPLVTLRDATSDDCRDVWAWRNDPVVRQSSKDSKPIAWESHTEWFAGRIADPACALLIGEEGGRPAGVLRFDLRPDDATISVFLAPGRSGRGLGPALIRAGEAWLRAHHPAIRRILADILPANRASLAAFEAAQYVPRLHQYERELNDE